MIRGYHGHEQGGKVVKDAHEEEDLISLDPNPHALLTATHYQEVDENIDIDYEK